MVKCKPTYKNPLYVLFQSKISGAIGGGDIDGIVNSMVEDVIVDYVNRFQGAISEGAARLLVNAANPFLDQLDTWRYIAVLLPRYNEMLRNW